jgi:hypothetical protein
MIGVFPARRAGDTSFSCMSRVGEEIDVGKIGAYSGMIREVAGES